MIYKITNTQTGKVEVIGKAADVKAKIGHVHSSYADYARRGHKLRGIYRVEIVEEIKYKDYSVFESGQRIYTGRLCEIAKFLGASRNTVRSAMLNKSVLMKKYLIVEVGDVPKKTVQEVLHTKQVPHEFKGTKMILHHNLRGELIKTTFLPLN